MKTKSKKKRNKFAYRTDIPPIFDLFGDIPVTIAETHAWVAVVAPRWYGSWRMDYYIENWAVVDKVQYSKQQGLFDIDIAPHARDILGCGRCTKPCGL